MFEGLFTALITPFKGDEIDYDALEALLEKQIEDGVDGVVPMGTTGESPTVSFEEHEEIIKRVVKIVNGRVSVIAGTGANSTKEAVWLTKVAQDSGVDGVLSVNPYYNKPTQKGLVAHFEEIARFVNIPVILYNIPGRSGVNFLPESIDELLKRVGNVKAVKEASGDIPQIMRLIELCGDRVNILSGDDNLLLPILAVGGKGIISVLSNLLPSDMKRVITLHNENKIDESRKLFYRLLPLCRGMFLETNPIPIKYAMEITGRCSGDVRLPLTRLADDKQEVLKKTLAQYGVKFS